jgi:hypothetical protein
MLDLNQQRVDALVEFTARVRAMLEACGYPPAIVTEHGRVAACVHTATTHHEPHCLHAHWLLFPGAPVVDLRPIASNVEHYGSFHEAYHSFEWPGQYLYSEAPAGECWLAPAPRAVPRQLLRRVVARSLGVEAAADWQTHPGLEKVDAARRRLGRCYEDLDSRRG